MKVRFYIGWKRKAIEGIVQGYVPHVFLTNHLSTHAIIAVTKTESDDDRYMVGRFVERDIQDLYQIS
jgi:hypothetical protein